MSYDLYFLRTDTEPPVSIDEFRLYFGGRDHYALEGDAQDQAVYGHEHTGVYFSFEHSGSEALDEDEQLGGLGFAGVSFNLNYFRPHVFGLEAEPEVRALVEQFGLAVLDPQTEGMGTGAYRPELFHSGWDTGNRFAYQHFQSEIDETPPSLPRDEIERCWTWNRGVAELQRRLGDNVFVPAIAFVLHGGRTLSYVVWGDAIPIALPRSDLVVLVRQELGSRRRLFRKQDMIACWVERSSIETALAAGRPGGDDYLLFDHTPPPDEIVATFLDAAESNSADYEGRRLDALVDGDVGLGVDAARFGAVRVHAGDDRDPARPCQAPSAREPVG